MPAAAAVAVGALIILLVPALYTVTPGTARVRRGRQAAISNVSRAGVDLALIALAVLAGWQLRDYSAVSAGSNGNFGVDPVIVIAPALALAGGTVVALRLLPFGGKAGDRLAARGRRLTAAMASWQISRQPLRQGGAALLIVLAVATGTLALSQRQSWIAVRSRPGRVQLRRRRAGADQPAAHRGAGRRLVQAPGVQHAMPVATFTQPTNGSQTLAIDADQAADVTLLRADQSSIPAASLFAKIAPPAAGRRRDPARAAGRNPAHRAARPRVARAGPGDGGPHRGRRGRERLPALRGHAARRRPVAHADRQPRQRLRLPRGDLPAAADLDPDELHDARAPAPRRPPC